MSIVLSCSVPLVALALHFGAVVASYRIAVRANEAAVAYNYSGGTR